MLNPPKESPGVVQLPTTASKRKTESLTIRVEDEVRIGAALANAAKKQMTGSIFSIKIDIYKSGTLGIGVKDLPDNMLGVSMLKRANGQPGAGELAGIRLGDVIFGINFIPTREGSQTLLQVIKQETAKGKKTLHIQCWRCHQLCLDLAPGSLFPRADDVIVQAHELYRTKVFSDWERWNFIEILLGNMLEDLKFRAAAAKQCKEKGWIGPINVDTAAGGALISPLAGRHPGSAPSSSLPVPSDANALEILAIQKRERARQMRVIDLERNILQAKGLRAALCVRVVHTKQFKDTVVYVLRVEDVETGLQWVVHRRYRDFHALNEELADMSHFTRDVEFPQKRLSIRNSTKLVESRIVALEQYIRRVLHLLTLYATMDPMASRSLRRLQNFLGVDKYIDCIHPPLVDDQRHIELMAYRFLNDFSSPACQQCVRFVTNVDLDALVLPGPEGHRPALNHLRQALNEVEQFVLQQHQQQMTQELSDRKPGLNADQLHTFVRRCVRRQVEAAIFLPLRRTVFRIVYSNIADQAQKMHHAMAVLQQATPEYFMVPPHSHSARMLPKAVKSLKDVVLAYLPADQGQLLLHAASAVMELHTECIQMGNLSFPIFSNEKNSHTLSKTADALKSRLQQTPRCASPLSPLLSPTSPIPTASHSTAEKNGSSDNDTANGIKNIDLLITNEELIAAEMDWRASPAVSGTSPSLFPADLQMRWSTQESSNVKVQHPSETVGSEDNGGRSSVGGESGDRLSDINRRMSTPSFGSAAGLYAIKPQSRLSFSAGEVKERGSSGSCTIDLTGAATMADPVREMFASVETIPPHSVIKIGPDRASMNLSFLCDDDDGEDGEQVTNLCEQVDNKLSLGAGDEQSLTPREPSSLVEQSNSLFSPDSPVTPLVAGYSGAPDSGVSGNGYTNAAEDCDTMDEQICTNGVGDAGDAMDTSGLYDSIFQHSVVSADDFLPMFTFVVVQASLPQLLIVKELMTALVDDEETYGECGYYLATLEASTQHIVDLAEQFSELKGADRERAYKEKKSS